MKVPVSYGWLVPTEYDENEMACEYIAEMYENNDNYTKEQLEFFCDVTSPEMKEVETVYDNEKFEKEFYEIYTGRLNTIG